MSFGRPGVSVKVLPSSSSEIRDGALSGPLTSLVSRCSCKLCEGMSRN